MYSNFFAFSQKFIADSELERGLCDISFLLGQWITIVELYACTSSNAEGQSKTAGDPCVV